MGMILCDVTFKPTVHTIRNRFNARNIIGVFPIGRSVSLMVSVHCWFDRELVIVRLRRPVSIYASFMHDPFNVDKRKLQISHSTSINVHSLFTKAFMMDSNIHILSQERDIPNFHMYFTFFLG